MCVRAATAAAATATWLQRQLHLLVDPQPEQLGSDGGRLCGRNRLSLHGAVRIRRGVRTDHDSLHGTDDVHQHHDHHRRAVCRLLRRDHQQHDEYHNHNRRLRRSVQMAGSRRRQLDEHYRPVRTGLSVSGAIRSGDGRLRSGLDALRGNDYDHDDQHHDDDRAVCGRE